MQILPLFFSDFDALFLIHVITSTGPDFLQAPLVSPTGKRELLY